MKRKLLAAVAMAAICPMFQATAAKAENISDIYDDASFNNYYTGLTGVVTSVLNTAATQTSFVVQDVNPSDQSASVIAYAIPKTTYTPVVGDAITFNGYDAGYQDAPELILGNSSSGLFTATATSHGNAFTPPAISLTTGLTAGTGAGAATGAEAAAYPYGEAIVTLSDVYFNSSYASLSTTASTPYYINDGMGHGMELYDYHSDSAVVSGAQAADAAFPGGFGPYPGTAYNITGYLDVYYGAAEIYPLSIVAAVPEPASLSLIALASLGMLKRRRRLA